MCITDEKSVTAGLFHLSCDVAGDILKAKQASNIKIGGSHHIYAAVIGFFASITGGISYCLIKAAAKASDQPV